MFSTFTDYVEYNDFIENLLDDPLDKLRICEKYLLYDTTTYSVRPSDNVNDLKKDELVIEFDYMRNSIFDYIKTSVLNDDFLKSISLSKLEKNDEKHTIFNKIGIHPKTLCFHDIDLKVILLNNTEDNKIDPDDKLSYVKYYIIYIAINEYIKEGMLYLESKYKEISDYMVAAMFNYGYNVDMDKKNNNDYDCFHHELFATDYIRMKLRKMIDSQQIEFVIERNNERNKYLDSLIMTLVKSLPFNERNCEIKTNIKFEKLLRYLHTLDEIEKNRKIIDQFAKKKFYKGTRNSKNEILINWYDITNILATYPINNQNKNKLLYIVSVLTSIYHELLFCVINFHIRIEKYRNEMKEYNEPMTEKELDKVPIFLYSDNYMSISAEIIAEIHNIQKHSTIQKIIRWHRISTNTRSKISYVIRVSEVISIIKCPDSDKQYDFENLTRDEIEKNDEIREKEFPTMFEKNKQFYRDHFKKYISKYNYEIIDGIYRTNWYSIKMFIMLSEDITLIQKHVLMFFLKCLEDYGKEHLDINMRVHKLLPFELSKKAIRSNLIDIRQL